MKVVLGVGVVAAQMPIGLVPEIFDYHDMVAVFGKEFRVVDPDVMEARYIENIIGLEAVRTTVWRDCMDC